MDPILEVRNLKAFIYTSGSQKAAPAEEERYVHKKLNISLLPPKQLLTR